MIWRFILSVLSKPNFSKKKKKNIQVTEADGVDGGCSAVQYALDHGIDAWREAEQGVLEAR